MNLKLAAALAACLVAAPVLAQDAARKPAAPSGRFVEIARFKAPSARQAAAVDAGHVYAITDRAIAKHDKTTGALVKEWKGAEDGPIIHLDSGAVVDGKLYAAHSNYPASPMTSSVEIWDAQTLEHVGSHSFGILLGSLTWLDKHDGVWWGVFANYSRVFGQSQQPYGNSYWTTLVKFDEAWKPVQGWTFPAAVIKRAEPMSMSGGSWGKDGLLYATGHDHKELYALRLPKMGSVLELVATYPIEGEGQGIAWDRSGGTETLWMISRAKTELIGQRFER